MSAAIAGAFALGWLAGFCTIPALIWAMWQLERARGER